MTETPNPTNRSTPVPGHRRSMTTVLPDASIRGAVGTWRGWPAARCACGWAGEARETEAAAVEEHTRHKHAVRTGEWAALFEATTVATTLTRAEPYGLLVDVMDRIEARNASFAEIIRRKS